MSTGSPRQTNPFHQFPLALLAAGSTPSEKLNLAIAYSTIRAGLAKEAVIGTQDAMQAVRDAGNLGLHEEDSLHRAWFLGARSVIYRHSSPAYCVKLYRQAERFLTTFGASPLVRVDSGLIEDVDHGSFPFRLFSVLCGVYAIIGQKQFALVRRDRVRAGALGYSAARVLFGIDGNITPEGERLLSTRPDGARPLTLNQARHTLNVLHGRGFFVRIQWPPPDRNGKHGGRCVYYSRGMDHDTLSDHLLKRFERKLNLDQSAAQAKLRESLLKRLTSGDTNTPTAQSPNDHRVITAEPTALIDSVLIGASLNRCSSNRHTQASVREDEQQPIGGVTSDRWDELVEELKKAAKGETP